ncbi:hypothetical protein A9Q97_00675 [Rhodospirillales bacterium 47_12_T64]|nr:hypothetical protein A9Q97_00675 [Rhodospirillales bacterium 47_12_T64]
MPTVNNMFLRYVIGAVVMLLSACANEPIKVEASRRVSEAVAAGVKIYGKTEYSPWGFGVCYGKHVNMPEQILTFARQTCAGGRIELRDEDSFWNGCPVIQGVRASFVCYPQGPKAPASGG